MSIGYVTEVAKMYRCGFKGSVVQLKLVQEIYFEKST